MSKEAMKLALEALENSPMSRKNKDGIDALREALAEQPAYRAVKTYHEGKPVYVAEQPAQRTWVGLTDDEVEAVWERVQANDFHDCVQPFSRAIEHKLKDKNT